MDFEIDDEALEAARRELNGELDAPREFYFACTVSEIPSDGRRGKVVIIEDRELALFNFEGEVFAISNLCPHEMSPILAAGIVDCAARTVTCPLHGWMFEIGTGKRLDIAEGGIPTYPVKIEDGEVWVEV